MSDAKSTTPGSRPNAQPSETFSGSGSVAHTWVEIPAQDDMPAAWLYTNEMSYRPGDVIGLRLSTNVDLVDIAIYRDGLTRELVHKAPAITGVFQPVPDDLYERGAGWDVTYNWPSAKDLRSGGYLIEVTASGQPDAAPLGHHLVFLRAEGDRSKKIALIAATSTWQAYNDFGGANFYRGIREGYALGATPIVSTQRPWARGQVWLPEGAPRIASPHRPRSPEPARYPCFEYAKANRFSRNYGSAGWASYELLFVQWAEANGYDLDVLSQYDLHAGTPELAEYPVIVFVGHCEYWSRRMREHVDTYIEQGGHVARFAGNFMWQIRLEDEGRTQVCYKYYAEDLDPVHGTGQSDTLTSAWEDPLVNWPGAQTFGANALRGIYGGGFGGYAARGPRGYSVFRPEHWSFAGTGLGYAEMFGDESNIFCYEVDGLDITFRDGLPFPTGNDGCPENVEILAMGWATLVEAGLPRHGYSHAIGNSDAVYKAKLLDGDTSPEAVAKNGRGNGVMVSFAKGQGEVFSAATCEWVAGLRDEDFYTTQITRNVLSRFMGSTRQER